MEIVLTIPDNAGPILKDLQNGTLSSLSRRILELATIRAYEDGSIGEQQVMDILGFEDREILYAFFKENRVENDYTVEDLERDSAALADFISHQ